MAFDQKYLQCIVPNTGNGQAIWSYRDTAAASAVRAAGYLALNAGFKVGDLVIFNQVDNQTTPTSVTAMSLMIVLAVATTGYPDLSDGTAVSVTNT